MKKNTVYALIILSFSLMIVFYYDNVEWHGISGAPTMDTRTVIVRYTPVFLNRTLEQGWNLISIPNVRDDENLSVTLSSINASVNSIFGYDASDEDDPWKAYNPNLPDWVVMELTGLDRKKGYWINMANKVNYTHAGAGAYPNIIQLYEGWNLIGYPTTDEKNISYTLQSIYPDYELVAAYNASDMAWLEYAWNENITSNQLLVNSTAFFGYWIYMSSDAELMLTW